MKKKIILLVIIIFVIAIIFLGVVLTETFIFYDKYEIPEDVEINISNEVIDVYDEINLYDLIETNNIEILSENVELDTSEIGEYTYTIEYKYKLKKYFYEIKYSVVDTVAPVFIIASTSKTLYVNEADDEDLISKITYADNYDIAPTLEVEGEVNFDEVGTYKITYVITDQSGNETTKDATIKIIKRASTSNSTTTETTTEEDEDDEDSIDIQEQIENYKTDDTMIGIDVSKWQGEIDFEKVKNAGVEFVIIRMGVMKDKDTDIAIDSMFTENYENAKNAGLKVGVYIYSESTTVESAIENAEFVIETLDGDELDFPVCFDWESWSYFNDMGINLHRLNEMYDAFSETLEEAGYSAMLYASENYLNNTWLTLEGYTLWVAKYSSNTPSVGDNSYILWQSSNTGRVDGIDGDVDLDVYYINR